MFKMNEKGSMKIAAFERKKDGRFKRFVKKM